MYFVFVATSLCWQKVSHLDKGAETRFILLFFSFESVVQCKEAANENYFKLIL
jgi:hypothetical protein